MSADELAEAAEILRDEFPETCSAYLPTFQRAVLSGQYGDFYENFTVIRIAEKYREFLNDLQAIYRREKEKHESEEREAAIAEWDAKLADPDFVQKQRAAMKKCLDENPYLAEQFPKVNADANKILNDMEQAKQLRANFEKHIEKLDLQTCELLAENLYLAFTRLDAETEAWAQALLQERITKLTT
jgi:hypothetical protein